MKQLLELRIIAIHSPKPKNHLGGKRVGIASNMANKFSWFD